MMLAVLISQVPVGVEGIPIRVEVDLRTGLPGVDIVGLPDSAVKEARERVRVAIRNSGFRFPPDRILVNLSPAGIRKEGASYDLPIALGILAASGQVSLAGAPPIMVLGELNLAGEVLPVQGVLSAVGTGLEHGVGLFLVPSQNLPEARALRRGKVLGIGSLAEAARLVARLGAAKPVREGAEPRAGLASGPAAASARLGRLRRHSRPRGAQASADDRCGRPPPHSAFRPSGQRQDHGRPQAALHPPGPELGGGAGRDPHPLRGRRPAARLRPDPLAAAAHAAPHRLQRRGHRGREDPASRARSPWPTKGCCCWTRPRSFGPPCCRACASRWRRGA